MGGWKKGRKQTSEHRANIGAGVRRAFEEGRFKPHRGPRDVSQIAWFTEGKAGEQARRIAALGGRASGSKKAASVDDIVYAVNRQFCAYLGAARRRGFGFTLSREEFAELVMRECWYCGGAPAQTWKRAKGPCQPINGIDRLDNAAGYVAGNVVSCCGPCNRAKHTQSADEFIARAQKIAERHGEHAPLERIV